jgi:hypothetical protein
MDFTELNLVNYNVWLYYNKKMRSKSHTQVMKRRRTKLGLRRARRRMRGRGFMNWLKSAGKWILTGAAGLAGDALGGPLGGAVAGGLTRKLLGNGKKKRRQRRRHTRRLR